MDWQEMWSRFECDKLDVVDQLYAIGYMDGWNRAPYPPKGEDVERMYWKGYEDAEGDRDGH